MPFPEVTSVVGLGGGWGWDGGSSSGPAFALAFWNVEHLPRSFLGPGLCYHSAKPAPEIEKPMDTCQQ